MIPIFGRRMAAGCNLGSKPQACHPPRPACRLAAVRARDRPRAGGRTRCRMAPRDGRSRNASSGVQVRIGFPGTRASMVAAPTSGAGPDTRPRGKLLPNRALYPASRRRRFDVFRATKLWYGTVTICSDARVPLVRVERRGCPVRESHKHRMFHSCRIRVQYLDSRPSGEVRSF